VFDPVAVHQKVPLYDITSITSGKPQIGRVIHLTFFSEEKAGGSAFFDVSRVILRGTTVIAARPAVATTLGLGGLPADPQASGLALPGEPSRQPAGPVRINAKTGGALRDWDGWINSMVRSGDLVAVSSESDPMLPGRTHERLHQYFKGVPVVGGDVTLQADNGTTASMFGTFHAGIRLDAGPALSAEEAGRVATQATGGRIAASQAPGLVVLPMDRGRYALAWHVETRSADDVRTCFVDAATGEMLLDYSSLKTRQPVVAGSPARVAAIDFKGDAARTARAVVDGNPRSTRGAAEATADSSEALLEARAAIEATRRFFIQRTGRFALDALDEPIPVAVHPVSPADWDRLGSAHPRYFAGAFWDGRMIVLGEGTPEGARIDGRAWTNAATSRDLVSHELAHAVLDFSAGLIYRRDSGALSEAFADIVAASVHFASAPREQGAGPSGYLVGDDVTSGGVRSLSNPAVHGNPDHYSGVTADGGVHANSTVASHAFYLAVEGGTNRTSGLTVEGVGAAHRDQIERAFLRAFVYMLPSGATFDTARAATIQSAHDLYGAGSVAALAIEQAWAAVGVR
jgi:Zn-dependent metalloprotease